MEKNKRDLLHSLYTNNNSNTACHPNAPGGGGGGGIFTQAGPLGISDDVYSRLPHPDSPAARYLTPEKIAKVARQQDTAFTIESIPRIMTSNKWDKAAALMNSWFKRSDKTAPDYDSPDSTTITMAWVLGFKRAKDVYEKLIEEKIWVNQPAKNEIANMLKKNGLIMPNTCFNRRFGDLSLSTSQLDKDAINFRVVGMSIINLDDMDAALGNFTFKIAIAGNLSSDEKLGKYKVEISEVGVYVRDSYDFNGDQNLGYWDSSDNSVSMFNSFSGTKVTNKHFRDWRAQNKKGGDFLVFSDIKKIPLNPPDTFFIS